MPRLSVVVPIYNVEEFLEPCLDSIAGQTFGDLEVVLVNDGATDHSERSTRSLTGGGRSRRGAALSTQPQGRGRLPAALERIAFFLTSEPVGLR